MHDPMTVAFEIHSPFGRKSSFGAKGRYYPPIITIWHNDPLKFKGHVCRRDDDSCGWFTPPIPQSDYDRVRQLGEKEWSTIFAKRRATTEGKSYAYLSFEPTTYDAVYWAWRIIKHMDRKPGTWKFGEGRNVLTAAELQQIQQLASNPVDNFQHTVASIDGPEACGSLFTAIYGAFLRHNRPWYRHPRWHVHHWRIQIHAWQQFRRWRLTRCTGCGKRFRYGESPVSFQWDSPRPKFLKGEVGMYHSDCSNKASALIRTPSQGNA